MLDVMLSSRDAQIIEIWLEKQPSSHTHPPAAAKLSGGPPMVCFEVIQQGDLLFELIDCLPTHGLFASNGRIRRIAIQSQARMVGGVEALQLVACQSFAVSRVPR